MGCSVFEVESWPAWHIAEWAQFYKMRPFGAWRDNFHAAMIADTIAKVNGNADIPMSNYFYKDEETAIEERKARDFKTFQSIAAKVKQINEAKKGNRNGG